MLFEHHRERSIVQRPIRFVALESVLDPARALEHVRILLTTQVFELEEMPNAHVTTAPPLDRLHGGLCRSDDSLTLGQKIADEGNKGVDEQLRLFPRIDQRRQ